jgi:formylglycine-generating enzyme required for sulfatase activity
MRVFAGMEFMLVPRGRFLMGSRQDTALATATEKPQHTVEIAQDYWLARFPVTNGHFEKYLYTTRQKHDWVRGWEKKRDHPVVNISWHVAMAFCVWLNQTCGQELPAGYIFRLPTEAEWEKAARGEMGLEWPWGNAFDLTRCNSDESKKGGTTPVGAYSPQGDSPYGCADMAGNVWEWTLSINMPYPYKKDDGRENPGERGARVLRGGSFNYDRRVARCASRLGNLLNVWDQSCGFRVGVVPPISGL